GRLGDGAPDALALGLEVIGPALLDEREADRGLEEMHAAMPEPGHGRQAPQPRVGAAASSRLGPLGGLLVGLQPLDRRDHAPAVLATLLLLALEALEQAGLDDDGAHLAGARPPQAHPVARGSP